jgi:Mannosyltransferase putative
MQIDLNQLYNNMNTMLSGLGVSNYKPGRSIVTTVYSKELASGFVLMRELAIQKVTLPIEIYYRKGELSEPEIAILKSPSPAQIEVKEIQGNAKDFRTQYGNLAGWSTKVYAVWESPYAENLWIDSDSYPIRNPEFLFEDPEYQQKGSLFWRDVFSTDRANRYFDDAPFWKVFNVSPNDAEPFESGQFLVNKAQCWPELNIVKHYADNCEYYYHFGGDAETWRMAWQHWYLRNGGRQQYINYHADPAVPYGFMPFGPFHKGSANEYHKWGGGTVMVQRDRTGLELFNHRNMQKFTLGNNPEYQDITNERRYHDSIILLKQLLGVE